MKYKNVSANDLFKSLKKDTDLLTIKKATELAKNHLEGKQLSNALNTAFTLVSLGLKENTISAALLWETGLKEEEILKELNEDAQKLVMETRKIKKIESQNKNFSPETLSKIILATTKDIRTIIIILSAKLAELRNTKSNEELAKNVMEVYCPISQKLGLEEINWELEDLSFRIIEPKAYNAIKNAMKKTRKERDSELKKIVEEIRKKLKKEGINANIIGRTKNFYGIYKKMKKKKCRLKDLRDLTAVRIICNTIKECYLILGFIHSMHEPLLGSFDDYIASPKKNNYRSIHTDLKTADGKVFEAQIRTMQMHIEAEEGMPAHWAYKELKKDKEFDGKLTWARELIEWQRKNKKEKMFETFNLSFEEKKIFTLTPKDKIIELPLNSTPLDFAYAIHSSLGNSCEKAKVNGKLVKLDHKLENGDLVEIITSKKQFPKKQWLSIVKSQKAKARIMNFLKIEVTKTKKIPEKTGKKIIDSIKIAKCCSPISGDKIFAIKTTKRKLIVHRETCPNLLRENKKKIIPLNWGMVGKTETSTEIKIEAIEKINLLTDILDAIASMKAKAVSTEAKVENKNISCKFTLQAKKPETITKIIEKIKGIDGVKEVSRV
ncbi:MAG: TGS domain-containing protein [archaeon]